MIRVTVMNMVITNRSSMTIFCSELELLRDDAAGTKQIPHAR